MKMHRRHEGRSSAQRCEADWWIARDESRGSLEIQAAGMALTASATHASSIPPRCRAVVGQSDAALDRIPSKKNGPAPECGACVAWLWIDS